jgi:hypothetical protein
VSAPWIASKTVTTAEKTATIVESIRVQEIVPRTIMIDVRM